MSKTAEEMTIAREFIKKTDLEKGSLWTETDDEIAEVLVDFHNQQSSSKDARIKDLEEQVKFWQNAEDKRDSEVKELEEENNGLKEQRQNDMMLASSAVNKIKELEASEKSWKDKAEFHFSESSIASKKIGKLNTTIEELEARLETFEKANNRIFEIAEQAHKNYGISDSHFNEIKVLTKKNQ